MSDNISALHSGRQKFRHSFLNIKRLFASIVSVRPRRRGLVLSGLRIDLQYKSHGSDEVVLDLQLKTLLQVLGEILSL